MAVDRADVCLILIDATEGFTEQDSKVAGYAHEQGKASIIVVNKWDLIEKDNSTMKEFEEKLQRDFSFMSYAPFLFISAKTGQRVPKLFAKIHECTSRTPCAFPPVCSTMCWHMPPPVSSRRRIRDAV